MEDYPRSIEEFEARFSSEETCREYVFQLRWPEGFRCPRCDHGKGWSVSATLWQCCQCDHQTSATAGTVFQDTRKPLKMWFRAMWYVTVSSGLKGSQKQRKREPVFLAPSAGRQ